MRRLCMAAFCCALAGCEAALHIHITSRGVPPATATADGRAVREPLLIVPDSHVDSTVPAKEGR